jgi:hypothetical protein
MKKRNLPIVTIFGVLLLWGCYPQGPDYIEDMDIVITNHNATYDFGTKGTYAMPDKIVKITGNLQEGDAPVFIPDGTAALILATIADNMEALGYQRVNLGDQTEPDLLLVPASWETTTISYWYDYWSWWYGGYYPGWGWGGGYYPYYPPVYVSSYTTGTLIMTLIDKDIIGANGNPVVQWTGAINGILTNTYDATRVNNAIDKAFDQSPYLKTN